MACKSTLTHPPTVYACRKLDMMHDRWTGELGDVIRRYGNAIWPRTPLPSLIGLGANTEGSGECVTSAGNYEIGFYNVPAGDVQSGDTACRYAGLGGTWRRIGSSAWFVNLVRRPGATTNWRTDIVSQGVIGLKDYKEKAVYMNSLLPSQLRATEGSQWEYVLGAMGYVSGGMGPKNLILAHPELAQVPETHRFGQLLRIAYQTNADGSSVCYPLVRAWERLFCGAFLAAKLNQPTDWYDVHLGSERYDIEYGLTRRWILDIPGCRDDGPPNISYYQNCHGFTLGSTGPQGGSSDVMSLLLAAGAVYLVYQYFGKN